MGVGSYPPHYVQESGGLNEEHTSWDDLSGF